MNGLRHAAFTVVLSVVLLTAVSDVVAQPPQIFTTGTEKEIALARSMGLAHLRSTAKARGIEPDDLSVSDALVDQLSMAHVRVRQSFRGIPVFGGEAIVHLRADGTLFGETDNLVPGLRVDPKPKLTKDDAIKRAETEYGCSSCLTAPSVAELWILRRDNADHLAYQVRLHRLDGTPNTSLPVFFIDAHRGDVIFRYDDVRTSRP